MIVNEKQQNKSATKNGSLITILQEPQLNSTHVRTHSAAQFSVQRLEFFKLPGDMFEIIVFMQFVKSIQEIDEM